MVTLKHRAAINPDPIQEAQDTKELQQNPSINTNLVIPKEQLQEDKDNSLQSIIDKLLEEKQNLQLLFERSENENQINLSLR